MLRSKGEGVVTISPDDTVAHLLEVLDEHRIGAVVVSKDGTDVAGIVSERDVVRHLHRSGAAMISGPVSADHDQQGDHRQPDDDLENVARTMTDMRIRHMPVVVDGRLTAIVSIGDIVKPGSTSCRPNVTNSLGTSSSERSLPRPDHGLPWWAWRSTTGATRARRAG